MGDADGYWKPHWLALPDRCRWWSYNTTAPEVGSQQETPTVFDTGATIGLSPIAKDLVAWGPHKKWRGINISGISSSTEVKGSGIIEWLIRDDAGWTNLPCPDTSFLHSRGKSPLAKSSKIWCRKLRVDLLRWHQREQDSTSLIRNVSLPSLSQKKRGMLRLLRVREGANDSALSHKSKANTCDRPQCAACHFAKMNRPSTGRRATWSLKTSSQPINMSLSYSVDCLPPKEKEKKATPRSIVAIQFMWMKQMASCMWITKSRWTPQKLSNDNTNLSKKQWTVDVEFLITVVTTGVYKPEAFVKDLELRKQIMKYWAICTVSESARAMLLHAAIQWPILFLNTVVAVSSTVICACFVDVDS